VTIQDDRQWAAAPLVRQRVIGMLGGVAGGAQGVILGCTQIELLIDPADSPVPVFPTTRLHVEAAVAAALQPSPLAPTR
jgi:aspartate/glutamate racemase